MRLTLPSQLFLKRTLIALIIFYVLVFFAFVIKHSCGCGFDFTSARVLGFITLAWFLTPFIAIFTRILIDIEAHGRLRRYSFALAMPFFCFFSMVCLFPIGDAIDAFLYDRNLSFELINREPVNSIVEKAYYVIRSGVLGRNYAVSRFELKLLPGVIWFYSETRKPSL